jgi:hypothetical protein
VTLTKATGPRCPECRQATQERKHGNWCPRCRGWVIPYTRNGETGFRLHNSYEPIRIFALD